LYIAQIIDRITPGGAEKLQITFAQEAHSRGLRLMIICLAESNGSPYPAQLTSLGANIYYFPSRNVLNLRRLWEIIRLLKHELPDVLHTHLTYANIVGAIAGMFAGVPVVSTIHTIRTETRHYHPIREKLETWALKFISRRVIVVGPAVAQTYSHRLLGKPLDVIPNAVISYPPLSTEERFLLRANVMKEKDATHLLAVAVGRLTPPKAFSDLLLAFSVLQDRSLNLFLIIVGTGALYDQLYNQIIQLGISDSVHMLGLRDDVPRLMAASDIFVSSSRWEGLPLVVLEAMDAGLPVVATNVGDVSWAVGEAGIIVAPGQPDELASALERLANDPFLRNKLGGMGKAQLEKGFSSKVWFDEIMKLYVEVCKTS